MEPVVVLAPIIDYPQRNTGRTVYAHISLGFQEYSNGELRAYQRWDVENKGLARLYVSCQIDGDSGSDSYAWKLAYNYHASLELDEIETMHKTLKPICTRYEKLVAKWFEPKSFGNYVFFVAKAAKVEYMAFPSDCGTSLMSIQDGTTWIDNRTKELKQKCIKIQAEKMA